MNSMPKGYKKTEAGVIPEDWDVVDIDCIADKVGSGITPRGGSLVYSTKGHPFIRSQNVGWGNFIMDDIVYISDQLHQKQLSTEVNWGDVLLNITGASIGRSSVVLREDLVGGNVNQHVCIIRLYHHRDSKFININILSNLIQNQIKAFQAGGNREGLNFSQVRVLKMPFPPAPERQAIAKVLSDMDALIDTQQALIAKKKDIKQGAMQDLLSGRVRLPGYETKGWKHTDIGDIPDDWEIKPFSDIAYLIKETVDPTSNKSLNCVELEHLSSSTGCLTGFDDLSDKNSFKNKFQQGDVLFGKLRSYLKKFWLCQWAGCCSTEIWVFRPKNITTPMFLKYIVSSDQFIKIASESFGTHMPRADWNVVKEGFFAIPSLRSEQKAIAQVLSDMDNEIETLEAELEKLNHMKRGMMQELLTGRIRLV